MTMNLNLTPDVQAGLLAQAQASGLTLEAYIARVLRERVRESVVDEPSSPTLAQSRAAGERIRELRKGVTLGGISIRELIEEGSE